MFKVINIFILIVYTQRQSCEVEKQSWSEVVRQMSYLMNPYWVNKNGKKKTVSVNRLAEEKSND